MSSISSKAFVRLRPHKPSDGLFYHDGITIDGSKIAVRNRVKSNLQQFSLNGCYGPDSTTDEVFECVQPLLRRVMEGQSATAFAYGVTGSGKTVVSVKTFHVLQADIWTMEGTPEMPGIIPQVVKWLEHAATPDESLRTELSVSYIEILKDEIYDLLGERLDNGPRKKLQICQNELGVQLILGLTEVPISGYDDFSSLYRDASRLRKTASTKLNSHSSRSHAILTFHVRAYDLSGNGVREGKIRLCDLAGSENNNLTGNDKERLRESSAINKSLTTLGCVIKAINNKDMRIPYRDTKLTRVLSDALGGSSPGMMICCLAPGEKFIKDSINSLEFATIARKVIRTLPASSPPQDRRASAPVLGYTARTVSGRISVFANGNKENLVAPRYSEPVRRNIIRTHSVAGPFERPSFLPAASTRCMAPLDGTRAGPLLKKVTDVDKRPAESDRNSTKTPVPVRAPSGITEERAKELFDAWYNERKAEEEKQAATLTHTSHGGRAYLQEPPRPVSALAIAALSSDERDVRGHAIIKLARRWEETGDKSKALKCFRHAKLYLPQNGKLADRITELQLYLDGEQAAMSQQTHAHDLSVHHSGMKRSRASPIGSGAYASCEGFQTMRENEELRRSKKRFEVRDENAPPTHSESQPFSLFAVR